MTEREIVEELHFTEMMGTNKHDFICDYVLTREGDPYLIVEEAVKVWDRIQEVCE
jgi:hypothetical protein